ncbi:uncharacterized protein LOC117781662 [Drosophila innubila]|uniref:uncharacterized protein LOC117781662 n=1 Tax=Drosophila innubila TaxID=198719 RepID=UPI00148C17C0|nr:uncharacterized protein LOC117781662 [Drosophila innubila]
MSCQLGQTGCSSMPQAVACCNQPDDVGPLCYAMGPYPDEVIMLALDRVLYYLGATKILHQLELTCSSSTVQEKESASPASIPAPPCTVASSTSTCSLMGKIDVSKCSSNSSISKYTTAKSKNSVGDFTLPKTSSLRLKSTIQKVTIPACNSRPRTPRVDFAHPVVDNRIKSGGPSISTRMKQSLSTCSLACRRLTDKLSANSLDKHQRWVWTRLVHSENGSKVYEVYQNSNTNKKPWKMSGPKQPVIVFLVLPNGHVMPFETISSNLAE